MFGLDLRLPSGCENGGRGARKAIAEGRISDDYAVAVLAKKRKVARVRTKGSIHFWEGEDEKSSGER